VKFRSEDCSKDYPLLYSEYNPKCFGQFAEHVDRNITSGMSLNFVQH